MYANSGVRERAFNLFKKTFKKMFEKEAHCFLTTSRVSGNANIVLALV